MKYRARRRVTSYDVTLQTDLGRRNANIVDVTECGARIRLEFGNLEPESEVTLTFCGRDHKARVVWNREGEAGIQFEGTLPLASVNHLNRSLHRQPAEKKRRFLMR